LIYFLQIFQFIFISITSPFIFRLPFIFWLQLLSFIFQVTKFILFLFKLSFFISFIVIFVMFIWLFSSLLLFSILISFYFLQDIVYEAPTFFLFYIILFFTFIFVSFIFLAFTISSLIFVLLIFLHVFIVFCLSSFVQLNWQLRQQRFAEIVIFS
jgi:hypothetical protein